MSTSSFDIRYDRRVDDAFLQLFLDDGPLHRQRVIAHEASLPLDLQFRKNPKTKACWASLYAGLTSVLDVHATARVCGSRRTAPGRRTPSSSSI